MFNMIYALVCSIGISIGLKAYTDSTVTGVELITLTFVMIAAFEAKDIKVLLKERNHD